MLSTISQAQVLPAWPGSAGDAQNAPEGARGSAGRPRTDPAPGAELLAAAGGKAPKPSGEDGVVPQESPGYANSLQRLWQPSRQSPPAPPPAAFRRSHGSPIHQGSATLLAAAPCAPRGPERGTRSFVRGRDPPHPGGRCAGAGARQAEDGACATCTPGRSRAPPWHLWQPLAPPNPSPSCIQDRGRRWSLCSMPGGPGLSGPGGRWALL